MTSVCAAVIRSLLFRFVNVLFVRHTVSRVARCDESMLSLVSCVLVLQAVSGSTSVVNVKLVPAKDPFPQVSAEIARLEAARGDAEDASMRAVEAAYETALKAARGRIDSVVAAYVSARDTTREHDAAAFLSQRDAEGSGFALRIAPVAPPSVNIKKKIDLIQKNTNKRK